MSSLVVVDDLDVVRVAALPDEADAPLIVDPDRVLALPIAPERLESMPWDAGERLQRRSRIKGLEASLGRRAKSFEGRNPAALRETLCPVGAKRSNHLCFRLARVTSYVNHNIGSRRRTRRGSISSSAGDEPKPFIWTKTADEILAKVARHAHRTLADRNS